MNPVRVLIVDDNVDFAFSLEEILKDESCDVDCVHTGEDAVTRLGEREFDIVLLDMKLPRISGVEVMFEARKSNPGARILFMSGHSVTDLLAQAVDGAAHRIFFQPYQLESLLTTLREVGDTGLVLVADSAPDIAAGIEQALGAEGHRVLVTADAGEAMEKTGAGEVDYLVLEQQQKVIDGLEIYWQLKHRGQAVPTVIIAPCPDERFVTIEKLNHFPNCGYFIKPFSPLDLLPVIENIAAQ